jgi:hypothetical protein
MFFRKGFLLITLSFLASCSALQANQSSESVQEMPESTTVVKLNEVVVNDFTGDFFVAKAVSVSEDMVSVDGSFGITGIPANRFYVFADYTYHGVYESEGATVSYEATEGTVFYWLPGESGESEDDLITIEGDATVSYPVDDSFVSLLRSAESLRLRIALGVIGEGSDMPTQLVVGREDISFAS